MLFLSVHIFFPLPTSQLVFFLSAVSRHATVLSSCPSRPPYRLHVSYALPYVAPLFTTPALTTFILFARSPFSTLFTRHTRFTVSRFAITTLPARLLFFTLLPLFHNACSNDFYPFCTFSFFYVIHPPHSLRSRNHNTSRLPSFGSFTTPTIPRFCSFHPP